VERSGVSCRIKRAAIGFAALGLLGAASPWPNHDGTAEAATTPPLPPITSHRDLIIVAGQSNATGAESFATTSGVNYLAPPYTNGADALSTITWWEPYVYPVKGTRVGRIQFVPAPLDAPQTLPQFYNIQIFGPELGAAREIYADTGQAVTVAKAAFGATFLSRQWNPTHRGGDYGRMIRLVNTTIANDARSGTADTVAGIVWFQGEIDALVPKYAALYQASLQKFINGFRSDLSATAPFVIVKIDDTQLCNAVTGVAQTSCLTGNQEVRSAEDWAAANMPNVYTVDTAGLPRTTTYNVHLNAVGELQVGHDAGAIIAAHLP
jgi:hypothetical protein